VKALLVLEDGRVFTGQAFGAEGEITAEVVFNTGMSGYQEILTDPSYRGQIINMTYPLIGNYGINPEDMESGRIQAAGFIVRELCHRPSNYRSRGALEDWLKSQGVIGLEGIDTRALTRHIRQAGSMNGILTTQEESVEALREKAAQAPHMAGRDLVKEATCLKPWEVAPTHENGYTPMRVTLIDCGAKYNIHRELADRGCRVRIVPAFFRASDILADHPDGQLLRLLKQSCRPMIVDGPNCVIGCLPDKTLFLVQDSKKLRPGIVGGRPGLYAFSSEMCGLDAAIPERDKCRDFQHMGTDLVSVGPDRKEVTRWNQWDKLPLQH